ncbi:MAG: DUF4239 domain-containing protein [Bacteroidia bacterium]|nr:DUF4239 domain-containing protein [Bacteroidia bacterium]
MVQIAPLYLFLILTISTALIAGLATYLFNKKIQVKVLRSHNEVTGFIFLAITSFYALLLSFVVFIVWGQLNQTRANASNEGSSAMGLYRDIKYYPDPIASKKIMTAYLNYVYFVVDEEFPNMAIMKLSRKTPESLSRVYYEIENLKPGSTFQSQLVTEMFNHLNQLDSFRGQRIMSIETEVPAPIWFPLIIGAIITVICSMLLDIEHRKVHIAINSMLGAFIGMFFFIIILLDHPYTGHIGIKPKAYKEIFTMEETSSDVQQKQIIQSHK